MKIVRSLGAALIACATFVSCSTSSQSYVEEISGYAVTRGRIQRVEDLHTDQMQPLTDGVAITVSRPGCRVSMLFDNDETRVIETDRGAIIVYGYANDYVLRAEPEWNKDDMPSTPGTGR